MAQVPKAIYDRIIVKKVEEPADERYGRITISDMGQEKPLYGLVVATGEGDFSMGQLIPIKTKVGDKVVFPKIGPSKFFIGKDEYISMREREILAYVVEE